MKVAIIGAGISGLATAYYLRKRNPHLEIQIFESTPRVGGLLETVPVLDTLMECGPDAFISEKPWALELCKELGLESEIIQTRSEHRRSFILVKGILKPIPAGFYLTAPKNFSAWWNLPGMSFLGKIRMLADLFIPARKEDEDESVATFVTRRFGKETLEKLAQPMIAGIYTASPEKLSLLATFPKFREIEKKYGSVMRGLVATQGSGAASGPRYSLFLSLRRGMESLPLKLAELLASFIQCATPIQAIHKKEQLWSVETPWSAYEADAICLAVPSYEASRILRESCPEISQALSEIRFEPVATINFLLARDAIRHPLDGFGFVVPAVEKSSLIGCSFSHQKFEGRALREDQVLLRAFVGGAYGAKTFQKTDEQMVQVVFEELKNILGIHSEPVQVLVRRYPQGMPQYEVGHLVRAEELFRQLPQGIFLTGLSYRGIGIPDCIKSAKETAEKITLFFESEVSGLRSPV